MSDTRSLVEAGPDTASGPGAREWRILAVVLVGSFMAVLDTTIVNVALPSIAQGIKASSDTLEWVVSGYALTFGLALVPAGRLGDWLGYKQMFLTGVTVFTLASVACGISRSPVCFGRKTVQGGIAAMFTGLALMLLVLHLSAPRPGFWALVGPLFLAGLGNGLIIAPNQDFVLGSVPRVQAGAAGGALITAQRIGAAIGIAVIGTALFGSGSGHSGNAWLMPSLAHTAQSATVLNLAFVLAAGCARSACPGRWPPNEPRRTPYGFRPTRLALLV